MHIEPFISCGFAPFTEEFVLQKLADFPADGDVSKAFLARDEGPAVMSNIKSYVRRKNKRKREVEQRGTDEHMETEMTEKMIAVQNRFEIYNEVEEALQTSNGFARSPCEGLRPRKGRAQPSATEFKAAAEVVGRGSSSTGRRRRKGEASDALECDIEGCRMIFRTKAELQLHKRNRCTFVECRKRFSNHKYAMRHQRVHNDERPLKCSWKGCKMSFKWEWARTEHLRLHTGERPYKCAVVGCGLSFRFVSDFSRHRRKTGHFVSTSRQ